MVEVEEVEAVMEEAVMEVVDMEDMEVDMVEAVMEAVMEEDMEEDMVVAMVVAMDMAEEHSTAVVVGAGVIGDGATDTGGLSTTL